MKKCQLWKLFAVRSHWTAISTTTKWTWNRVGSSSFITCRTELNGCSVGWMSCPKWQYARKCECLCVFVRVIEWACASTSNHCLLIWYGWLCCWSANKLCYYVIVIIAIMSYYYGCVWASQEENTKNKRIIMYTPRRHADRA